MIVTTYQHDYIPPHSKKYDVVKGNEQKQSDKTEGCQCKKDSKIEIPKTMQKQQNVEWTGIAPMGRLIYPRNIPTAFSNEQLEAMMQESQHNCQKEQQNRFLKILPTVYPDLYERLKQMPADELNRRLDNDRLVTTYQIDFCDINEYPEGIYKSLKVEDDTSKLKSSKLLQRMTPCYDLEGNKMDKLNKENLYNAPSTDPCEKSSKPFKISFADSSRFINSGNSSHWRGNGLLKKERKFTEYMETISKIGCIITKNNIHDHQKCTKRTCSHKIAHACTNIK